MGGVIVSFAEHAERGSKPGAVGVVEPGNSQDRLVPEAGAPLAFRFWEGASGSRYVHHVYSLIGCPQLPASTYLLVGLDADGVRTVLHVGHAEHEAPSLNLAEIRHKGATVGAAEVHVHMLAARADRNAVRDDLARAHAVSVAAAAV